MNSTIWSITHGPYAIQVNNFCKIIKVGFCLFCVHLRVIPIVQLFEKDYINSCERWCHTWKIVLFFLSHFLHTKLIISMSYICYWCINIDNCIPQAQISLSTIGCSHYKLYSQDNRKAYPAFFLKYVILVDCFIKHLLWSFTLWFIHRESILGKQFFSE